MAGWNCTVCESQNEQSATHCIVCDQPKGVVRPPPPPPVAGAKGRGRRLALAFAAIAASMGVGIALWPPGGLRQLPASGVAASKPGSTAGSPSPGASSPSADERKLSYWRLNGSALMLFDTPDALRMYYFKPSGEMAALGVGQGTLLFDVAKSSSGLSGVANVFVLKVCGAVAYRVTGQRSADGRTIVLTGQPPEVDRGCKPIRTGGALNTVVSYDHD